MNGSQSHATRNRTRVLQVINSLGEGGAERSTAEAIAPLRDLGVDIEVATLHHRREGVEAAVEAVDGIVHRCQPGGLERIRSLRNLISEREIDVVHTALFDADIAGRLAAILPNVPVLTSLVNMSYEPIRLEDPAIKASRLRAVQAIDAATGITLTRHFHAITDAVADAAHKRLRIPRRRITVIPRGRDEARLGLSSPERRLRVRQQLGLAPEAPVLLAVGRHEYQKGLEYTIDAHAQILQTHPGATLLLAGREGNATNSIRSRIESSGTAQHVRVLGHTDDVPDLMAAADVLLFPSLFEGLGGTLIEAMALRLPIVTTDLAVTREVADQAARFVPPNDGSALAEAAFEVLRNHAVADQMRSAGRARFESDYQLGAIQERMAALYAAVARGSGYERAR